MMMVIRATLATNMAMAMMGFTLGNFFKLLVGTVLCTMLIIRLHWWWYILLLSSFWERMIRYAKQISQTTILASMDDRL